MNEKNHSGNSINNLAKGRTFALAPLLLFYLCEKLLFRPIANDIKKGEACLPTKSS